MVKTKETTLLCYRLKSKQEVLDVIEKYKHTDIVLVLETKIEKLYFSHNMMQDCIINVLTVDELLNGEIDHMKFDHTIGNPPYQKQVGPDKTQPIWPELVVKFEALLKNGGDYNMIHPGAAWRFANENAPDYIKLVKEIYSRNQVTYLEMNDSNAGKKTFNAETDYDVISMIKVPYNSKTQIKTKSEGLFDLNIQNYGLIPTDSVKLFDSLKAVSDEEKVVVMYSSSAYETRKSHTSETKDSEFKYPIVYTIRNDDGMVFWYSNTKDYGHFGQVKLILKKGTSSIFIDSKGEYGLTQFAFGIIDSHDNLEKIKKVMETTAWRKFQADVTGSNRPNAIIDGLGHLIKFIKEMRKDFWKEFYTEEMDQELIKEGKINA